MMWELIRRNRIKSMLLLFAMGAVLFTLGYFIGITEFDNALIGVILAATVWLILVWSSIRGGNSVMMANTGAYQLTKSDTQYLQLYNIVEEMKIAANMDFTPQVYLIGDNSLNAFAVGNKPKNYAIVLTTGLVNKLNRNELQAVVAHELSHISNGDSQFMTLAGTILGAIYILRRGFLERRRFPGGSSPRFRSSRSKSKSKSNSGSGVLVAYLILAAIAILGVFLANMFYFAISRKREYLADASAVRLTRYPEGLASALEKIACNAKLATANSINAPLFIVNPLTKSGLFDTHPPIKERINILRKMSGGADFANYQQAYSIIKGKDASIIPSNTLRKEVTIPVLNLEPEPVPESNVQLITDSLTAPETSSCETDYLIGPV